VKPRQPKRSLGRGRGFCGSMRDGFFSFLFFDCKHCKIGCDQAANAQAAANPKTTEASNARPPSVIASDAAIHVIAAAKIPPQTTP
jgi:hypothetical protein